MALYLFFNAFLLDSASPPSCDVSDSMCRSSGWHIESSTSTALRERAGCPHAHCGMAHMFSHGKGVEQSHELALYHHLQAADAGLVGETALLALWTSAEAGANGPAAADRAEVVAPRSPLLKGPTRPCVRCRKLTSTL